MVADSSPTKENYVVNAQELAAALKLKPSQKSQKKKRPAVKLEGSCTCSDSSDGSVSPVIERKVIKLPSVWICAHEHRFYCRSCEVGLCQPCWDRGHCTTTHHVVTVRSHEALELKLEMQKNSTDSRRSKKQVTSERASLSRKFLYSLQKTKELVEEEIFHLEKKIHLIDQSDKLLSQGMDSPLLKELRDLDHVDDSDPWIASSIKTLQEYLPEEKTFSWVINDAKTFLKQSNCSMEMDATESCYVQNCRFYLSLSVTDTQGRLGPQVVNIFLYIDPIIPLQPDWAIQTSYEVFIKSPVIEEEEDVNLKKCDMNFRSSQLAYGWEFISLQDLLDPKNLYIQANKLEIVCNLRVWKLFP